jgi:predicted lysophospholipase L1 biosynthesis ABC-type transport system permease subunit
MDNQSEYIEDLRIIKKVMEESSRFLSLSGLSGIFAGIIALAGAVVAVFAFMHGRLLLTGGFFEESTAREIFLLKIRLSVLALIVLTLAIGVSLYFSYRKSVQKGLKMWTPVSRRLLINLMVPLATGGILILIFYFQHNWQLVVPSMLIFYGLALVSAGKFTYNEIFYLGLIEILTGLISVALPVYAILFWGFGFGLLHLIYGSIMYRKYER